MGGRSVGVSRLRICECDGGYAEAAAEIERGAIERQVRDGAPEIKLIAAPTALKALEEIARDVNREAAVLL